jgi:phosphoribosylaminoimidazole carboxylase (NCAIR synthetase)
MSTIHQARRLFLGSTVVFALTLLAPVAITAEDEVAVMAPVAAPAVVGPSAEDVRATRALAAQHALLTGDIGSMQEEALFAIVGASTTAEPTRVLAAQQALRSPDLGSLQEEALTAIVEASSADVER